MTSRLVRLSLGTMCALGLARFAYGLLVPAMRGELGWTLAQAGGLTTANAAGYLLGALATAPVARRIGTTTTFRLGMVVTVAGLAVTAVSPLYPVLLATRTLAGFSGALVFITGSVIAARAGGAVGITVFCAGSGLGIALAGASVPPLVAGHLDRWPLAWLLMAVLAVAATALSWGPARAPDHPPARPGRSSIGPLWTVAVAYFCFAVGYLSYVTFLSAYLVGRHASTGQVVLTWTLLGAAATVGPMVWTRPVGTWPGSRALALALAVLGASAGLALGGSVLVVLSAVPYGLTMMNVPAAVTAHLRTNAPAADLTGVVAAFTVVFAVGQTAGPWLSGLIADHTAVGATLAWTAVICVVGALFALLPARSPVESADPRSPAHRA